MGRTPMNQLIYRSPLDHAEPAATDVSIMPGVPATNGEAAPSLSVESWQRHAWPPAATVMPLDSAVLSSIIAILPQALVVMDVNLRVRHANPAFYRLAQLSPEETDGRLLAELGEGEWDIPWLSAVQQQLSYTHDDGEIDDLEIEQQLEASAPRTLLLSAQRLTNLENETLVLLTIQDISERKAMEQRRSDFILLLAHELRHPVTSIRGYAQLLQRRNTGDERALATVVAQTRQMERLIDDLLDGSSRGAGELRLEREPTDLLALVRASVQHARLSSDAHPVRLELPDGALVGQWDSGRLSQVFDNLLDNAIKYSPDGGKIVVRIEADDALVQVSVQDQGVGIASDDLPRVFDQFYRVAATARTMRGLGLGLPLVKTLIAAHGGSVAVESVPAQGSTFRVTLPLTSVDGLESPLNETPRTRHSAADVCLLSGPQSRLEHALAMIERCRDQPPAVLKRWVKGAARHTQPVMSTPSGNGMCEPHADGQTHTRGPQ